MWQTIEPWQSTPEERLKNPAIERNSGAAPRVWLMMGVAGKG